MIKFHLVTGLTSKGIDMNTSSDKVQRRPRPTLSIVAGNITQGAGIVLGCALLYLATYPNSVFVCVFTMIAGYLLVYFSSHSLTHYIVGGLVGIKFTHYSVGGTSHPENFPAIMRPIFVSLPFFAVHA